MKNSECNSITAPVARHRVFVPGYTPFQELRTTLDSAIPYAEHFHSAFSLGLILQGTTCFSLGGTTYLAEKGDIVLIAEGQPHSCNPVNGPRGYHMLLIDAAWLREHIPDALETCAPLIKDAALFHKAEIVIKAVHSDPSGGEVAVAMLAALLLEIYDLHKDGKANSRLTTPLLPTLNELGDAKALHDAKEVPRVSRLAREAGMSRESFSRAVRRKTGLPPSRYLHCLRIEKARWLLRQGKSITETALASGYADQSHFHRMFVRLCAITPGRYRHALAPLCKSHSYKK